MGGGGLEPLTQFVEGKMGDDLDRLNSLSLAQNRVSQRNQWADRDISAAQLAERILSQYRPALVPLARAGD